MRKVTAITVFRTAEGIRMSTVFSEINEDGMITRDNARNDRILVNESDVATAQSLLDYGQECVDKLEV